CRAVFSSAAPLPPSSPLFPYTTLFRSTLPRSGPPGGLPFARGLVAQRPMWRIRPPHVVELVQDGVVRLAVNDAPLVGRVDERLIARDETGAERYCLRPELQGTRNACAVADPT